LKKKTGFGFALVCPEKRFDRGVKHFSQRSQRNRNASSQPPGPGIDNIMVSLHFSRDQEF
jgi:hypothetical protein